MIDKKRETKELQSLRATLRAAMPPIGNDELRRDLWPLMLQRMERSAGPLLLRVPWFDWALLGAAGALLAFFPAVIPALLYHL